MLEGVIIRDELDRARPGLEDIARDSGVNHGYLKQLSSARQGAGEPTLAALGRGMMRLAVRFLWLAARFLSAAGDAAGAQRARGRAVALWKEEGLGGEGIEEPEEELPPPDAESETPRAARRGRKRALPSVPVPAETDRDAEVGDG